MTKHMLFDLYSFRFRGTLNNNFVNIFIKTKLIFSTHQKLPFTLSLLFHHYCSSKDMAMAIFNIPSSSSSPEGSFFSIIWKIESHCLLGMPSNNKRAPASTFKVLANIVIPYIPQYNECRCQSCNHPRSFCLESNARLEHFLQQSCVCHRGHKSRLEFRCLQSIPLHVLPHRELVPENICIYQLR